MALGKIIMAVWTVVISIITTVLAYGGYRMQADSFRPHLSTEIEPMQVSTSESGKKYFHFYRIENTGDKIADDIFVQVVIKSGHVEVSKQNGPLTSLFPSKNRKYNVFVDESAISAADQGDIYSELELTYRGENILLFFCSSVYKLSMRSLYSVTTDQWLLISNDDRRTEMCDM